MITKIVPKITLLLLSIIAFVAVAALPVQAQTTTRHCTYFYGIGTGPYGQVNCVERTPFSIGTFEISDDALAGIITIFSGSFGSVVSAFVIKSRLQAGV